jgi:hypothetical protein
MEYVNVEDLGEVTEKEWLDIKKKYFKEWKELKHSKGKFFCKCIYGEPSDTGNFPPTEIKGVITSPIGTNEVSYRFGELRTKKGEYAVRVTVCLKCGNFRVEYLTMTLENALYY